MPVAAGSARAYGKISSNNISTCSPNCLVTKSKNISNVTYDGTGAYCVGVTGVDTAQTIAVVSVDWNGTADPEGNASAMMTSPCDSTHFGVQTDRIPTTAPVISGNVSTAASGASNVSFEVLIP